MEQMYTEHLNQLQIRCTYWRHVLENCGNLQAVANRQWLKYMTKMERAEEVQRKYRAQTRARRQSHWRERMISTVFGVPPEVVDLTIDEVVRYVILLFY